MSGLIVLVGFITAVFGVVMLSGVDTVGVVAGSSLVIVGVVACIGGAVFGGATRGVFGVALYRYLADQRAVGPFTASDLDAAAVRAP